MLTYKMKYWIKEEKIPADKQYMGSMAYTVQRGK